MTEVYDGFISYSHAADDLLAPRLQSGLQRFAKPWWKRRALRVFRDESSLSANPHLWSSITEALDTSGWFVLLLSPDAASSEWVNQEIEYWKTHKDASRILPVLTDGTFEWSDGDIAGTAVPGQLEGVFSEEPRWVDMRFARDEEQLDLKNPRFSAAVADIASALRGVPKDELESEEVKQHRRSIRTAWAAGALVLLLGIAAVFAAIQASRNAEEAERQAEIAEQNAVLAAQNEEQALAQAERADANAAAEAEARTEAEASAQLAKARELAASAIGVVDEDPRLATWLALTAIDQTPGGEDQPVEVVNALWEAVAADPLEATIDHGFGGTTFVDLSPDGRSLAVSSAEGATLRLRDAESFEILWSHTEETEDGFARPVFSPDGSMIALDVIGSEAEEPLRESPGVDDLPTRVVILDTTTGEAITVLEFPECQRVGAPAWSPDGTLLAVSPGFPGCARDGVADPIWIEVFDTDAWESRAIVSIPGDDQGVRGIFLSEDRLGAFRSHNPLQLYDTATFELVEVLEEVADPITADVSIDGGLIAVHSNETLLGYLYDLETGSQLDVLGQQEGLPSIPFGVSLSADGSMVAYATNRVLVWNVATGERIHKLTAGAGSTNAVFSPNGSHLYSAHDDGTVRVWNLAPGSSILDSKTTFPGGSFINSNFFQGGTHIGTLQRFEFVPDFVAFQEFFSTSSGEIVAPPLVTDRLAIVLSNDLVVGKPLDSDRYRIFDPLTENGREIGPTCAEAHCEVVRSATGDEFAIVAETEDSQQWHYFEAAGEPIGMETFVETLPLPVAFDDDWLLTGTNTLFSIMDRATRDEILNHPATGARAEVSHNGRTLALRNDPFIELVDTESWDTQTLDLGSGSLRGIAFSPDDSLLAIGRLDDVLIIDLAEQEIVQEIPLPLISDFHWIDDSTLIVGNRPGSIWGTISLDINDLIDRARSSVADRPLTEQECLTYRIDPCPRTVETDDG